MCVLKDVGFEEDEAHKVFAQVNGDGQGGVSLEEFEEWMMKNQREQSVRMKPPVKMTYVALGENLEKLIVVLKREKLDSHVDFFTSGLAQYRQVSPSAKDPHPGGGGCWRYWIQGRYCIDWRYHDG